ncbi:PIN domain-containing protein [Candidatus Thiosymbion oneisti]|uniref:PIN domain-containing protein n=1 Tax=Candidatus Thiosymbion oneisti TaxID=589554 RepID=UPI0013FE4B6F|nr:PIN domain-containing protein [Candidatus Thiosymbion oneisti]
MSFVRRIVIDTGVLVSAAIRPESVPALALEKALLQFKICASDETLAELETVLMRPKFDPYVGKRPAHPRAR